MFSYPKGQGIHVQSCSSRSHFPVPFLCWEANTSSCSFLEKVGMGRCCMPSTSRGGDVEGSICRLGVFGMSVDLQANPQAGGDLCFE